MQILDMIGNPLADGDYVTIKTGHVVGQILKVNDGSVTLASSLPQNGQVSGEIRPHVIIKIQMDSVTMPLPSGQCPDLLKVCKPEKTS
jgi:hypothetical protein